MTMESSALESLKLTYVFIQAYKQVRTQKNKCPLILSLRLNMKQILSMVDRLSGRMKKQHNLLTIDSDILIAAECSLSRPSVATTRIFLSSQLLRSSARSMCYHKKKEMLARCHPNKFTKLMNSIRKWLKLSLKILCSC